MPSEDLQVKIDTYVTGRAELEKTIADLKKLVATVDKDNKSLDVYTHQLDRAEKALKDLDKMTAQIKSPDYAAQQKAYDKVGKSIVSVQDKMRDVMVQIDLLANKDDPLRRAFDPTKQKELDGYRQQMLKLNKDLTDLNVKQNKIRQTMGEMGKTDLKFMPVDYDKAIGIVNDHTRNLKSNITEISVAQKEAAFNAKMYEKTLTGKYANMAASIRAVATEAEGLDDTTRTLVSDLQAAGTDIANGKRISGNIFEQLTKDANVVPGKVTNVKAAVAELREKIGDIENTKLPYDVWTYFDNLLEEADRTVTSAEEHMKGFGEAKASLDPVTSKLSAMQDIMERINAIDLSKAIAFNETDTINTYNNLVTSFNELYESYDKLVDTSSGSVHELLQVENSWLGIDQAITQFSMIVNSLRGADLLTPELSAEYNKMQNVLIALKQRSKQYTDEAKKTQGVHKQSAKAVQSHKNQMKSMSDALRDSKKNFEKINKAMSGFTNTLKSKLGGGLKTIMKYVLGFRSLFFMVRKIRAMIKEGLDNLVQFESATNETNHQITNLQSSLLFLKNALAAAFAPIINVIVPILNTLIDKLAETANAIAMFFARLTGQATVIQAVKVQVQDYADSLKDAGKSAGGAAKKVKDLHDRLAPFDDLQVLGVDKDKDRGGSGSGSGGNDDLSPKIEDMFKRVATEGGFADMIRDAFEKGSLFEVGNLIGEKIKGWFLNIPWVDIKEGLSKGISLVTSFLNGLLTTDGLFETIGRNLAAGFNILVSGIKQFFEEVDWYNIFSGFATGISEFLNDINYEELLMTGIAIAQAIVDGITGFLNKFDIVPAINKFLSALKNATSSKEFSQFIGDTKGLAKKLLKKLDEAIRNIKWEDLSEAIGGIISAAINNITEDDLDLDGSSISYTITHAITWAFVQGIKNNIAFAKPIAQAISNWLGDVFGNVSFAEGFKAFAKGFYSIFSLQGLIKILLTPLRITLSSVMPAIVAAIYEQITGIDIKDKMKQLGEDVWNGMIEGMWNIVKSIPGWIYENLFEPFIEIIKWLFDIGSPSKVMEELGVFVMEGFFNGIKSMVDSITQIFKDIKTNVINKITELKSRATDIWTSIKQGIVNIAMTIKGAVTAPFTNIKDSIIDTMKSLKTSVISIWEGLWSGMKNIINDNILAGIEKFCNGVIDGINNVLDLGEVINKLPAKLKEKFELDNYTAPSLSHVEIPRLASGAVIPPNREFLAMLGDQRSGTNIEAPLDTIVDAFRNVIGSMQIETGNQVLQVDGQTFARLMTPYVVSELGRRGYNVKILEA